MAPAKQSHNATYDPVGTSAPSEPPASQRQISDRLAKTTALVDAADANIQKFRGSTSDRIKKIEEEYGKVFTDVNDIASPLLPSLLETLKTTKVTEWISKEISAVVDNLPALLKLLQYVEDIHPFIKPAVGAFEVAIKLYLKRQDNDDKVTLLIAAMRDMLAVLLQLNGIAREDSLTTSAHSGRMKNLIQHANKDITACANFCDAYVKRCAWSKVLRSGTWSGEIKTYIEGFQTRRGEFQLELSIYIGHAINAVHDKVDTTNSTVASIDQKVDYLISCLMSNEECELTSLVDKSGGPGVVMQNEGLFRQLVNDREACTGIFDLGRSGVDSDGAGVKFEDLQKELFEDVKKAVAANMTQFAVKVSIQQRELQEALELTICRESNHIAALIESGPHDKILDPDIRNIWKRAHWHGGVKGRDFILELRDYFRKEGGEPKGTKDDATTPVALPRDGWALEYMDVTRLQAIIEGFDDDAASSSYITVAEVNTFTSGPRPANWSLLHWLAYWAIGYQMTMSEYAHQIDILLAKMFALKQDVLPANRNAVEQYLHHVWTRVTTLTLAFRRADIDKRVLHRFKEYNQDGQKRLLDNLTKMHYNIDAEDTLCLICGPGPIEKHIFPLLYLLLKRDFEIMRLASRCHQISLHKDELEDSMRTIFVVLAALVKRYEGLADLFRQQRLDPSQQFGIFAFGMFKYLHDQDKIWSLKMLKEAKFMKVDYDGNNSETEDIDLASILKHPIRTSRAAMKPQFRSIALDRDEIWSLKMLKEAKFMKVDYDGNTSETKDASIVIQHSFEAEPELQPTAGLTSGEPGGRAAQADPLVQKILGQWTGFCGEGDLYPSQSMISFLVCASPDDAGCFLSTETTPNGMEWNLTGKYTVSDAGHIHYNFSIAYAVARFQIPQSFCGVLDESGTTLSGTWVWGGQIPDGDKPSSFLFKRLSPQIMRFYPRPAELSGGDSVRRRALWRFAICATRVNVGQKTGSRSWSLLQQRWVTGRRYAKLVARREQLPLTTKELVELARCQRAMTPEEVRTFSGFKDIWDRSIAIHWGITCDACGENPIRGSRILCLSCGTMDSVDLCGKKQCQTSIVRLEVRDDHASPHLPSHDVVKLRAAIHPYREHGEVYRAAKTGLETVRRIFAQSDKWTSENGQVAPARGPPMCVKCHKHISKLPCWYCIECKENIFVCVACDSQRGGITVGQHKNTHALVHCCSLSPPVKLQYQWLWNILGGISSLEGQFASLDERLKRVDSESIGHHPRQESEHTLELQRFIRSLEAKLTSLDERLQRVDESIGHHPRQESEHALELQRRIDSLEAKLASDLDERPQRGDDPESFGHHSSWQVIRAFGTRITAPLRGCVHGQRLLA